MFGFKGIRLESKKELSLKVSQANSFSSLNRRDPNKVTGKITDAPYDKVFIPAYKEKTARERYMKEVFQKDNYKPPSVIIPNPKPKKKTDLNSNDIACRDMYNNCNVKDYVSRRNKSTTLKRSYTCGNLIERTTMNSRLRKQISMSSDIFFTSANSPREAKPLKTNPSRKMDKEVFAEYTKSDLKTNKSFGELVKKAKVSSQSKYASHCDWRYTNTEPVHHRSKTVDLGRRFYRKGFCTKSETELDKSCSSKATCPPDNKKYRNGYSNKESTNYDLVTTKPTHRKAFSLMYGKKAPPEKSNVVDEYQIVVNKSLCGVQSRQIKNMFISEGIHLFNFTENEGDPSRGYNNGGVFKFKVRNGESDPKFKEKMSNIHKKIKTKNMKLEKLSKSHARPL